jgi:hypothetical protein
MKTIYIDQQRLVKAIAHLTHKDVDPSEWPWMVAFNPEEETPTAEISLPSRVNTQGSFESLPTEDEIAQPSNTTDLPEPAMATPLAFVALEDNFHWDGEIPDIADRNAWTHGDMAQVTRHITQRLRHQVEIENKQYQVSYQ